MTRKDAEERAWVIYQKVNLGPVDEEDSLSYIADELEVAFEEGRAYELKMLDEQTEES